MILITGASSGLGAALANIYGNERQSLLLTGRNEQRLAQVMNTISGEVNAIAADLCQPLEISALLDSLSQVPDTVIHCAGSGYFGAIEQQQPDSIGELIHNNLTATILLLRELVKRYRNDKINVVVVMSTAAQVAKAGESTYCAVKWAIRGLVESLRLELKGSPMKLIAVYPGGMATDFWKTSGKELDTSSFMTAQEVAIMLKHALVNADNGYVSDITINRA